MALSLHNSVTPVLVKTGALVLCAAGAVLTLVSTETSDQLHNVGQLVSGRASMSGVGVVGKLPIGVGALTAEGAAVAGVGTVSKVTVAIGSSNAGAGTIAGVGMLSGTGPVTRPIAWAIRNSVVQPIAWVVGTKLTYATAWRYTKGASYPTSWMIKAAYVVETSWRNGDQWVSVSDSSADWRNV